MIKNARLSWNRIRSRGFESIFHIYEWKWTRVVTKIPKVSPLLRGTPLKEPRLVVTLFRKKNRFFFRIDRSPSSGRVRSCALDSFRMSIDTFEISKILRGFLIFLVFIWLHRWLFAEFEVIMGFGDGFTIRNLPLLGSIFLHNHRLWCFCYPKMFSSVLEQHYAHKPTECCTQIPDFPILCPIGVMTRRASFNRLSRSARFQLRFPACLSG